MGVGLFGGGDIQAGEDVDVPDSIHGCLSDRVSPTRQVWSVQGQISWRATRDPHGVSDGGRSKYLSSAASRLQRHAAQQGRKRSAIARFDARPSVPGAAMAVSVDAQGYAPPKDHPTPTSSRPDLWTAAIGRVYCWRLHDGAVRPRCVMG